jgi:hypothetical protein
MIASINKSILLRLYHTRARALTFSSTDEAESVATMDKRHGRVPPLRMQVQEAIQVSPC